MNAIEIEKATKKFGTFTAVNDVSLQVPVGAIFGFLGPNGSGKSTTIRMICGVLRPSQGCIRVMGMDVGENTEEVRHKIGYMSQRFGLYEDLTVAENIEFYAGVYGLSTEKTARHLAEILTLMNLRGREKSLAGILSGGLKQRLALGCALIHSPALLILDEPTAGVDPVSRRIFWEIIYTLPPQGVTVLVTTHYMDEAESCDLVSFIFNGAIINTASPARLMEMEREPNLENIFIKYVQNITGQSIDQDYRRLRGSKNAGEI